MPTGVYVRSEKVRRESSLRRMGQNEIHGMSHTKFCGRYYAIRMRCSNPNFKDHKLYYDKGIKCEWSSFLDFKKDMYKSYLKHIEKYGLENTSIDRIDFNGNYSKKNCRWATIEVQANNTSSNIWFTMDGKTKTIAQWCRKYNINNNIVYDRIGKLKWDTEIAIKTPKLTKYVPNFNKKI